MRVLAIDPSISKTGWAVVEDGQVITYGTIKTTAKQENLDRIIYIVRELKAIFVSKQCECAVIEKLLVFRENSAKTIEVLMGLYYHINLEFWKRKWLVVEIAPSTWKKHCRIEGKKRAEQKVNSIEHVKNCYGLDVTDDEADAICLGEYGCVYMSRGEKKC